MDIANYTAFFHDGSLRDIWSTENNIFLILESAEINPNEIEDVKILSKSNTLFGKLHLKNIKSIKLNRKVYTGVFHKFYDDGEILDFEVYPNEIFLLIEWSNFPPKPKTNDVSRIEIETDEIYWENMSWAEGYKFGPNVND